LPFPFHLTRTILIISDLALLIHFCTALLATNHFRCGRRRSLTQHPLVIPAV